MELAAILEQYYAPFMARYAGRLLPAHRQAIGAMLRCRTPAAGELRVRCTGCEQVQRQALSCGHRSCPKCQNHAVSQWLDRQQAKLLPVDYFLVTFTLPYELRALAWRRQSIIYSMLLACATSTLKDFGLNPGKLGAQLGMTAVLHTHNRRLDYHPHGHVVVPGGGIDQRRRQWKQVKGRYLFNALALAKVFRARFLAAANTAGPPIPRPGPGHRTAGR